MKIGKLSDSEKGREQAFSILVLGNLLSVTAFVAAYWYLHTRFVWA